MGAWAQTAPAPFGVANLPILLMHLSAVALCISAQVLLLQWAHATAEARRRARGWIIAGVAVEVVLVLLFVAARAWDKPPEALAHGSHEPIILTYLLIFITSQTIPCLSIMMRCVPYARMTPRPWLRRSLRVVTVAAALLFLYCAARTVNIVSPLLGLDLGNWAVLATLFSSAGILTMSIGVTMPSWGEHVSRWAAWARTYRSYRALRPLWDVLYATFPDIALEPPSSAVTDLNYRLYRRVIEIRDGLRALRPYVDDAGPHACAAPGAPARAMLEAAKIDQAIRARAAGAHPRAEEPQMRFDEPAAGTDALASEVAWLTSVARAYRRLGDRPAASRPRSRSAPASVR
jgi:uncharacterized protein DUF6545